jgi:predicted transcriptional regulator
VLADVLKCSQSTIARYEAGEIRPRGENAASYVITLDLLAEELGYANVNDFERDRHRPR